MRVQWALNYGFSLTVVGGGHSSHCLWPTDVSADMGTFSQVHIVPPEADGLQLGAFIVTEAGFKSGDIVRQV